MQRCAQHIAAGTHAHGRTARWVRARPRCRKESCGVGAAPRCAQLRGLAPHRRFPQHKAPRSGADRGQTLAEALRERARGRAVSALSSASLFLPISFFSSCCLLNFLLSLFSFTSYLFLLAFSGASFLALPFSFPLFSFSYSFSYSFLLIHPSFRFHSSVVFPVCFSVSFFSHNFYLPFSFCPFPLSSFASFSFSFIFISFLFLLSSFFPFFFLSFSFSLVIYFFSSFSSIFWGVFFFIIIISSSFSLYFYFFLFCLLFPSAAVVFGFVFVLFICLVGWFLYFSFYFPSCFFSFFSFLSSSLFIYFVGGLRISSLRFSLPRLTSPPSPARRCPFPADLGFLFWPLLRFFQPGRCGPSSPMRRTSEDIEGRPRGREEREDHPSSEARCPGVPRRRRLLQLRRT